jgi:hypothetical protein
MQRLAAAVLLGWINFTLIFAAARPVASASSLPACCRRLGKHACGTLSSTSGSSTSGPAFQAAACPLYPRGQAVPAQAKATGVATPVSLFALAVTHPALLPQLEARVRISCGHDQHKRGPPVFLS